MTEWFPNSKLLLYNRHAQETIILLGKHCISSLLLWIFDPVLILVLILTITKCFKVGILLSPPLLEQPHTSTSCVSATCNHFYQLLLLISTSSYLWMAGANAPLVTRSTQLFHCRAICKQQHTKPTNLIYIITGYSWLQKTTALTEGMGQEVGSLLRIWKHGLASSVLLLIHFSPDSSHSSWMSPTACAVRQYGTSAERPTHPSCTQLLLLLGSEVTAGKFNPELASRNTRAVLMEQLGCNSEQWQ